MSNVSTVLEAATTAPSVYMELKSDYVSPLLESNPEARAEVEKAVHEHHRTAFYDLTEEQAIARNEYTLENIWIKIQPLTYDLAVHGLGLELVQETVVYQTDPETGENILDDEGKPIRDDSACFMPDHTLSFPVAVAGFKDCNGVEIPIAKGRNICFRVTRQATNRPQNESNYTALVKRMAIKWMLNGETCIKDCTDTGISEQHRYIARVILSLVGGKGIDPKPAEWGQPIIRVGGIHPDAAITADTGKTNSGKDIFASDPELVPTTLLQEQASLAGNTDDVVYLTDRMGERVKACGKCESATKQAALRMAGKNVQGNLGNSNEATELAHRLVSTVLPDMDDLATYCHVFACPRIDKSVPVQPNDLCAALALYAMRDSDQINVLPRTGIDGGTPLDEATPIRWDCKQFLPLLNDLVTFNGPEPNRLTEWVKARGGAAQKKESKAVKFAQLCRMIVAYFDAEDITASLLNRSEIGGPQTAKSYYHFGGSDCGPLVKAKKSEA